MVRLLVKRISVVVLFIFIGFCVQAQEIKDDFVKIRFVDSQGQSIPYFASHVEYVEKGMDKLAFWSFVKHSAWDELLPYQDVGGGIMPMRKDKDPYFVDSINIGFEMERIKASKERFKNVGLKEATEIFVWYFPNGQICTMTIDEVSRLQRGPVNVVEISGDLGTGSWKDLGNFLFDAAYFWRVDRGSKSALVKRCDALIDARNKAKDLVWKGNLVFVREHWLRGNPRTGLFARARSMQTPELDQELPWRNAGREFGREGAAFYSYPLKPYLAFKRVMEVNPEDKRAIFWTQMLPWVNGFSLAACRTGQTTGDYIRECRQVYRNCKERLDDYHRFWYLKEFLQICNGMTYEARSWLMQKGVRHDEDIQWAIDELNVLFEKYYFLRYQIDEIKKWILYMKDPDRIETLDLIGGK